MYAIFFDGEFKFKFTCFCLCSLKNRETKSFLRFFFTLRSHAAEGVRVGLTGGVKSHRLSGQISPYCEKKRHWLCAYCAPMFVRTLRLRFAPKFKKMYGLK